MILSSLGRALLLMPILALVHCGGATQGSAGTDGGVVEDASAPDARLPDGTPIGQDATPTCTGPIQDPPHRPTASACKATPPNLFTPDAGTSCQKDADCQIYAGEAIFCVNNACTLDQCLEDSDCPQGTACVCGDLYYGGNGAHGNQCMQASCKVDADCGAGGRCSPHIQLVCGAITGLSCHSAADTCASDADCCATPDTPSCNYDEALGHWACGGRGGCNG